MNIMHLRSSEFFGGPERAILGQCRCMIDMNFVCASFVRQGSNNPFLEKAEKYGLETFAISEAFAGDFRVVKHLRKFVREHNINLIVSHDYKGNLFGRKAARKEKIGHIAHFRGLTSEDSKVKLYNFIDRQTLSKLPCVMTVSHKSKKILENMGISGNRVTVIFNAIESGKLVEESFSRKIDDSEPFKFIAAGRLSYEKGYDVLLEAAAIVKKTTGKFTIDIYGHGPEDEKLNEISTRLDLKENVFFKGFVDDVLPVLKAADCLVLPSRSEGMPNILLEAWSQKLGVVSTSVGGVPEMIIDNVGGLICEPEKPEELADIMIKAIKDLPGTIKAGEDGYNLVRNQYTFEKQAELLREIYADHVKQVNKRYSK